MSFADSVALADVAVRDILDGEAVSYAPASGPVVALEGMFDANYVLLDEAEGSVEQVTPSVFLDASQVALIVGDIDDDEPTLTIRSIDYVIRERQPEGQGGTRLLLHLAAP